MAFKNGSVWYQKEYLKSPHWEKVKKRDSHILTCQLCGRSKKLNRHHLSYENLYDEEESDIVKICTTCHWLAHRTDNGRMIPKERAFLEARFRQLKRRMKNPLWKLFYTPFGDLINGVVYFIIRTYGL